MDQEEDALMDAHLQSANLSTFRFTSVSFAHQRGVQSLATAGVNYFCLFLDCFHFVFSFSDLACIHGRAPPVCCNVALPIALLDLSIWLLRSRQIPSYALSKSRHLRLLPLPETFHVIVH